jgi:type II secretory pathway component PulC
MRNPWWLVDDSAYIAQNTNSDYAFATVQSGDVAYALGLRSGDVPITINNLSVTSISGVASAYMELWTETEFNFIIIRPGVGPITLAYEVVP